MAIYELFTWAGSYLLWAPILYLFYVAFFPNQTRTFNTFTAALPYVLYTLATKWLNQVTKYVPEPYMDEVFHIPQAQAYCVGDFHIWDPKLTTPPGLYLFTSYFCNLRYIRTCTTFALRRFNSLVLVFVFAYAATCRARILSQSKSGKETGNVIHTAFNVALFPPLFFFGGLFYTDVLSTVVVLRMYALWLENDGGIWLYLTGMLALTMRQTNIFWAAMFMGGLETVRTLKTINSVPGEKENNRSCWQGKVSAAFHQYTRGEIHDISLKYAEIYDFPLCAISIAVALISHPVLILKRLWPYIFLLFSFALFVIWNGGVVLGDKSAHVATIHLPQLLYLWAFIAFFSFPLLLPSIFRLIQLPFTARPTPLRILLTGTTILGAMILTLVVVHFNTLIHPYTLADNRHYMFYIFRYTILLHPLIKYALAPIYILLFLLCKNTLYGSLTNSSSSSPQPKQNNVQKPPTKTNPKTRAVPMTPQQQQESSAVSTSHFLIWLLATALSLMTAPLVEPRYFILPWLFWRLHIPSSSFSFSPTTYRPLPSHQTPKPPLSSSASHVSQPPPSTQTLRRAAARKRLSVLGKAWGLWKDVVYREHDMRLWGETGWFLVVNGVTGWVFLMRGFAWESEPGMVQRFMW